VFAVIHVGSVVSVVNCTGVSTAYQCEVTVATQGEATGNKAALPYCKSQLNVLLLKAADAHIVNTHHLKFHVLEKVASVYLVVVNGYDVCDRAVAGLLQAHKLCHTTS
jgi:hypothetical protein